MGANVWQRDGGTGRTFATGVQPRPGPQRAHKRQLVWRRGDADGRARGAGLAGAPGDGGKDLSNDVEALERGRDDGRRPNALPSREAGQPEAARQHKRHKADAIAAAGQDSSCMHPSSESNATVEAFSRAHADGGLQAGEQSRESAQNGARSPPAVDTPNCEDKLRQIEDNVRRLQQELLAKQARIAANKATLHNKEAAEKAAERARGEEQKLRKKRLEAGFAEAFKKARDMAAADMARQKAKLTFADEAEVRRVLGATSDYDVLRLRPGVDTATLKRRYREMAMALHPDKCQVDKATDAFQRLIRAYQCVLRFA